MKYPFFIGLGLLLGTACQHEEEQPAELPDPTPLFGIEVSEQMRDGAGTAKHTATYMYDEESRLTACVDCQIATWEWQGEVTGDTIRAITEVAHEEGRIVVTDESGNSLSYLLDGKGCAITCTLQNAGGGIRRYTFDYVEVAGTDGEAKRHLKEVTERLDDNQQPYSRICMDYTTADRPVIVQYIEEKEQAFELNLPATDGLPNTARIPCLFLTELYPLSLHVVALYGGWLGDAYGVWPAGLRPLENAASQETVAYGYETLPDGWVASCTVRTHSYGMDYARTVGYRLVDPASLSFPQRSVAVTAK